MPPSRANSVLVMMLNIRQEANALARATGEATTMLPDPQLELLHVTGTRENSYPHPWMLLGGELQPHGGGWEGGIGGLEESSKEQKGREGFAPNKA